MRNEIQLDNIKFWVDQNIVHCNFNADFHENYEKIDIEEIFYNGISILSSGRYMPIIINLEQISDSNSIKIFRFLSKSVLIQSLILTKIFLVRSIRLKVLLVLYNVTLDPALSSRICKDFNVAIKHCNKENLVFNTLS
jgi:hypothetical protein